MTRPGIEVNPPASVARAQS